MGARIALAGGIAAIAFLAAQAAQAAPPTAGREQIDSQGAPPAFGLTGDWGGLRTSLGDMGIYAGASTVSEAAWNMAGGERHRVRESGQLSLGFTFDADQLVGLKGGTLQVTTTYRRGKDLTTDAGLGLLQQVQEVYGRGNVVRLTQFWYEQGFADGKVALKVGRGTVGEDFASFSCYFMNLSFCGAQPGNLTDYWYNWPVSQWMGRLRVNATKDSYAQVAAYEINPRNLDHKFMLGRFHGATGVMVPVEAGWTPSIGPRQMIAQYKIGGWWTSSGGDDVLLDVNRQLRPVTGLDPLQRSSRYGVYVNLLRQFGGSAKDGKPVNGWGLFLNVTQTDRKTATTDNQIAAGLFWKGFIPALPDDVIGVAVARTHVNGRYARAVRLDPADGRNLNAEYASEIYYNLHAARWLELRPNFQYIWNPGGDRTKHDVAVLGIKVGFTL